VVDKIRRVLDRDIPILLGETGTGKEVFARAIHQDSRRAQQPFVAVNCASIPETLIEAELFGYEEGAPSRAAARSARSQAHGGTLFLDEIGDMPLSLQAHLLRVLQERQVMPLGGSRAIPVDERRLRHPPQPARDDPGPDLPGGPLLPAQRSGPEAARRCANAQICPPWWSVC
jgi:transcriptional regulator with PAS, ATPase and Fis domain